MVYVIICASDELKRDWRAITSLPLDLITYSTIRRRILWTKKSFKAAISKQIKYISTSKETLKLLLNIQIILPFNKIQLLQKQQFVKYFVKQQDFSFYNLRPLSKNMGNMRSSLANQIVHILCSSDIYICVYAFISVQIHI